MFVLHLIAINGEKAILDFNSYEEALALKNSFMLTGDYIDSFIELAKEGK